MYLCFSIYECSACSIKGYYKLVTEVSYTTAVSQSAFRAGTTHLIFASIECPSNNWIHIKIRQLCLTDAGLLLLETGKISKI
jgi:hypothetical protein